MALVGAVAGGVLKHLHHRPGVARPQELLHVQAVIADVAQAPPLNFARIHLARFAKHDIQPSRITGDNPALFVEGPVYQPPLQDILRGFQAAAPEPVRISGPVPKTGFQPPDGAAVGADIHVLVAAIRKVAPHHGNGMALVAFQIADGIDNRIYLILVFGAKDGVDAEFQIRIASP